MAKHLRWAAVVLAVIALLFASARWSNEAMTSPPDSSDSEPTRLSPCPDTPNCVSTNARDPEHAIEPISFDAPIDAAELLARVRQVVEAMGGKVTEQRTRFLRAEFTTPLLRFIDDVEFLLDEEGVTLHFRSASRVGRSDLGVNRNRMERFRTRFESD